MIRLLLSALLLWAGAVARAAELRSGYQDAGPAVRAMQDDDAENPAFLWIAQGRSRWTERVGSAGKSCADCHGDVTLMRGVAARYPTYDLALDRLLTLEARIQHCRAEHQQAQPLVPESDTL